MMSQPHKATTREALRAEYGFKKRTFGRVLKRAGITHRRRVLTPKEVSACYCYLIQGVLSAANNGNAPQSAN